MIQVAIIGTGNISHAHIAGYLAFPERNEGLEEEIRAFADRLPPLPWEGHTGQIEDMLSALEQDRSPAITGEDGRRTLELITAIYQSGSTGAAVELPIRKDNPFYTVQGILAHATHFYEKTVSAAELTGGITLGSSYRK